MAIKQSTFYIILLSIGSFLIIFFLTYPTYRDHAYLSQELDFAKKELANKEKYIEDMKMELNELNEYQEEFSMIDIAIPKDLYVSSHSLVEFMEEVISTSGLTSSNMSVSFGEHNEDSNGASHGLEESELPLANVGTSYNKETLKETEINLTLIGSYEAFKNFIFTVSNSSRLISVENISFSSKSLGGEGDGMGIFTFDLTLKVFNY